MDSGNFRPPNSGQGQSREQQAFQEHIDPILNYLRGNNSQQQQQQRQQPRGYSDSSASNLISGWHEQQRGLGSHGAPPASAHESISDKGNLLHQQINQRQHIAQAHSQHITREELEQALQFANNKHQHQPPAQLQPPSINSNNNRADQDRSQHVGYHQLPSAASALLGSMRSQSEQQLTPSGGGGNWPPCLLAAAGGHQALHPALYGNPRAPSSSSSSSCANSPASVSDIYAQQQQQINRVFQSMLHSSHQAAAQQQQQQQVSRDSSSGSTTIAAHALPPPPPLPLQLPSHLLPGHLAPPPASATPFDLYSTLQSYAALTHTYMSRGGFGSTATMASSAPGLLHHLPSATMAALQGTFPAIATTTTTPSTLLASANTRNNETLLATNAADDSDMLDDDNDDDREDEDDDDKKTIKRHHHHHQHYQRNRRHSQASRVGPLESANLFESERQQHRHCRHHHHHHASGTSLEACTMSAPPAIAHNRTSENAEQSSPRLAAEARSNSLRGVASTATTRETHQQQHSSLGRATGRNSSTSLSPPSIMPTFRASGKGVGAQRLSISGDDATTRVVGQTYQRDQNKQAFEFNDDTTTDDDVKMSSISIDGDDEADGEGNDNARREKQKDVDEEARAGGMKVRDDDEVGGGSSGSTPCNSGRIRTAYSSMQILNLEREFAQNMYLSRIRRIELAQKLSLSEKQVKIWFQNRRVKYKKENPA